ncbi:MAG: hypothetical protein J1F25_02850, partial [Prevotellaceae bacterium]|nr:hypothetical protein [Prevotellaceae bacterium]
GYFSIYDLEGATYVGEPEPAEPIDEEQEGQWTSVGMATFVDAWIMPSYSMGGNQINPNENAYEVELQQNVANPYLYRLWEPYKNSILSSVNTSTYHGQIVFDISDPDHVEVVASGMPAGFKNNNGEFYVSNELGWYVNYGIDRNTVIDVLYEGEPADTYQNGVVTITTPMFDFSAAQDEGYSWNNNPYYSIITFPASEEEVVGTYDWTIQPTDIEGTRSEAVTLQVEVKKENDNYTLAEVGETNYFNGTTIPFTYDGTNATFTAFYAGQLEGNHVWFSPFVFTSFTEPNATYAIAFDAETGFAPNDDAGFGWFTCEAADDFSPSDLYVGYFLKAGDASEGGEGGEGEGGDVSYPEFSTLVGTHTFTATLELLNDAYAEQLLDTYEFSIHADKYVKDFIATNNPQFTYNQEVGTITFSTNNWGSFMDWDTFANYNVGIADADGNWNGVGTCNVVWQVTPDGHILIPDFTIVNYTYGSNVAPIVARYTNCKVDGYPADEA